MPQSSPKPTGFAAAVIQVSKTQRIYSISEVDFTLVTGTGKKIPSIQTSARTGVAVWLRAFGPVNLYTMADGGAATTGANSSGALAGGGMITWPTRWPGVLGTAGVRVIKTALSSSQAVVEIGIVWGGGK